MVYVLLTQNQKDTKPRSSNGSGFFMRVDYLLQPSWKLGGFFLD